MRTVSIDDFDSRIDQMLAAAEAGDEMTIMHAGIPAARLTGAGDDRQRQHRIVVAAMVALGRENLRDFGPTSADEIVLWKNEGGR